MMGILLSILFFFFLLFCPTQNIDIIGMKLYFVQTKGVPSKKKLIMMNRSVWPFFKWTGTFFLLIISLLIKYFLRDGEEKLFFYPLTFENEKLQLKIAEKKIIHSHLAAFIDFFRSESSASETSTRKSNLSGMITWEKIS